MQMLYNSDNYVVVQFDQVTEPLPERTTPAGISLARGGFEIVDKMARTDIFIEGALAERFQRGVQELVAQSAGGVSPDALDDYIAGFTGTAPQPLVMH